MRLQTVLIFAGVLNLNAAGLYSQQPVTLSMHDVAIEEVIKEVEKQSTQTVIYNNTELRKLTNVSVEMDNASAVEVLNKALSGTGLVCKVMDDFLVISHQQAQHARQAPTGYVEGVVVDKNRKPILGATVRLKDSNMGVGTDVNGKFRLSTSQPNPTIVVSFVGMKTTEVKITDDQTVVVMEEDQVNIDQVVINGVYKPVETFTGAVTEITAEELRRERGHNIMKTIENFEPSFRITENLIQGSNPNRLPEVHLRGQSTLLSIDDLNAYNNNASDMDGNKMTEEFLKLNSPIYVLDGFEVSQERVMDLNEEEIDNIVVLKDASATSLYGSRGANGVVLITSKQPEAGKLSVSYSGRLSLEIPDLSTYDLLSAKEKLVLEKEYKKTDGTGLWDARMEEWERYMAEAEAGREFDWLKEPVRTGIGQSHSLSLGGGTQQWRIRFDLQHRDTKGVMKGSDRRNSNGTLNVIYQGEKFMASQIITIGVNKHQNSPYGVYSDYVYMNPYYYPWDENGEPVYQYEMISKPGYAQENPLYNALKGNKQDGKYTSIRSGTNLRYNVLPELMVNANIGLSRQITNSRSMQVPSDTGVSSIGGRLIMGENSTDEWEVGVSANYVKTFNEKHIIAASVSSQAAESINSNYSFMAVGFKFDNMMNPGMSTAYPQNGHPEGSTSPVRRLSFLGSVNYYYDKRFFMDASISQDGASSYGRFSRYGTFWSVGAGWAVGNERFIRENLTFVSDFRVRYSYGVSGNMGFRPEDALQVYGLQLDNYLGGVSYTMLSIENPDLKWQNTYQHSAGVELSMFNNRISLMVNYYNKLTKNAVNNTYIPISTGFERVASNIGTLRNVGWEYNVHFNVLQKPGDGLNMGVNFRFASNRNTVVKLSESFKEQLKSTFALNDAVDMLRYREGHSMSALYGLRSLGVDPGTGQRVYLSTEGKPVLMPHPDDLVYLGDREPKLNGTIGLFIYWKGFRLNANMQFRMGGMAENGTELRVEGRNIGANMDRRVLKDVWQKPGDIARYKNPLITYPTFTNSKFVHTENTLSMGSINVEYRLPEKLLSRIGVRRLSIGVDLADIFYISSISRERGISYPFSRNPNFNVILNF